MYMVYLSVADQYTYQWSTTVTQEFQIADAAFHELVEFRFLTCRPFQVTVLCNEKVLARHRFDSPTGSGEDWRGRRLSVDLGLANTSLPSPNLQVDDLA